MSVSIHKRKKECGECTLNISRSVTLMGKKKQSRRTHAHWTYKNSVCVWFYGGGPLHETAEQVYATQTGLSDVGGRLQVSLLAC